MIERLRVVGPFRGWSGYDRHTREFVREFVGLGVDVQLTHLDGWSIPAPEAERETWLEALSEPVDAQAVVHFTMPIHARPQPDVRNVNYTMFEAERIPQRWASCAYSHDRIAVPTNAAREAWLQADVPEEHVSIAPLGVRADAFTDPTVGPLDLHLPDGRPVADFTHRFLHVAELRPRKNHLGLLRAWIAATTPTDDAVLVLKTTVYRPDVLQTFNADAAHLPLHEAAPVITVPDRLTQREIVALYRAATHYVSLSHGEGWDLVTMEAAVAGLELIAPRHTAYLEYLDEDDAHWVPSELGPAVFEGRLAPEDSIFFEGLRWWHPDEEAAAQIIREIVNGTAPRRPPPSQRIAQRHTWQSAARRLLAVLEEEEERQG